MAVTALVARLRPRWEAVVGQVAELVGVAVRQVGRGLPGVAGPLAIAYGFYEMYSPLGWIVAGGFLLLLDRRVP